MLRIRKASLNGSVICTILLTLSLVKKHLTATELMKDGKMVGLMVHVINFSVVYSKLKSRLEDGDINHYYYSSNMAILDH